MKKIVTIALFSSVLSAPVFAEDNSASTPPKSHTVTNPQGYMHGHKMGANKDECDAEHEMGNHHHGHDMMDGAEHEMMMEPDMFLLRTLTLSKEQQSKIHNLSDELKHKNWAAQGLINDESAKLRDLYEADKRDPAAIGKEYQKVFDLKRQMIESYLDTQNRVEEVLTPEQRAKMKDARHEMHRMHESE